MALPMCGGGGALSPAAVGKHRWRCRYEAEGSGEGAADVRWRGTPIPRCAGTSPRACRHQLTEKCPLDIFPGARCHCGGEAWMVLPVRGGGYEGMRGSRKLCLPTAVGRWPAQRDGGGPILNTSNLTHLSEGDLLSTHQT